MTEERRGQTAAIAQPSQMSSSSATLGGRGLQLLLLTTAITCAVHAKVALGPLQETMRVVMGLSDNQMALLQGPALAISMVAIAVPLGLVIDRYSRVRLLIVLLSLLMIGTVMTALAPNFAVLFVGRTLVGLGAFPIQPVVLSLIADHFAAEQRGRASMLTLVGQYAAMSAIFAVGGQLITFFGTDDNAWRFALLWLVCPLLVLVMPMMFALREPPRSERVIQKPSIRESFVELWRYRSVIGTLLAGIVVKLIPLHSAMIWAAPTLTRNFSLGADHVGMIMAIVLPIGGIGGSIVGGVLADACQRRGGPRRTIAAVVTVAALSAPLGLFAVVPNVLAAAVMLACLICAITAVAQMTTTVAIVAIPNELRGLYFAIAGGVGAVFGVGLGPLLVSTLSGAVGGQAAVGTSLASICVIGCLLSATTYGLGRRYFHSVARV